MYRIRVTALQSCGAALVMALCAVGWLETSVAAPVSGLTDVAVEGQLSRSEPESTGVPERQTPATRTVDRRLRTLPEAGGTEPGRPASAAHVKVPLPNTNLSGGVLTRLQGQAAAPASAPTGAVNERLLGALRNDLRERTGSSHQADQQRQWTALSSAGGTDNTSSGGRFDEVRPPLRGFEEPGPLRALRECLEWVRQNRWEVLVAVLILASATGILKAYSRRP